jgi:hypothetical protein
MDRFRDPVSPIFLVGRMAALWEKNTAFAVF